MVLVVALLVGVAHHDHPVGHDRRRGVRDHLVLGGIAAADLVLPLVEVAHEVHHAAVLREAGQVHPRAPALHGPAGLGVEAPEEEARGHQVDHPPAVHVGVGDPLPVVLPHRALPALGVGLPEDPEGLARGRVDRRGGAPLAGHGVEDPVHVGGRGPEQGVGAGPEVVPPPGPRHREVLEVGGVDLVQGREAAAAGVPAPVAPLPVLGPRAALARGGARSGQKERRRGPDGRGKPGGPDPRALARSHHRLALLGVPVHGGRAR